MTTKADFVHARDVTSYYCLAALQRVIVPWVLRLYMGCVKAGMGRAEAFHYAVCQIDKPAMSREFHRLVYDQDVSFDAAWQHVRDDFALTGDDGTASKLTPSELHRTSRELMRLLNVQHDVAVRSIPPQAKGRFKVHGIPFKCTDPCELLERMHRASLERTTENEELYLGALRRLSRLFVMLLCEVADSFMDRDDNTVALDDIVRSTLHDKSPMRRVWVVLAVNPDDHFRVARQVRMRENTVNYITFKGRFENPDYRRVEVDSKIRSRSPTRIFDAELEASRYADHIKLKLGREAVILEMLCVEVTLDNGTVCLVVFDGRFKDKWGDARRVERKLTEIGKGRTHVSLWSQMSEDVIGITHIVVGVKQTVPQKTVKHPYDPDDDKVIPGVAFNEDDYRVANRKDAIEFAAFCKGRLWRHPSLREIKNDTESSADKSENFWNEVVNGVFLKDARGFGLEHQITTVEDDYNATSSTGDEGHKYRRAKQDQRDLRTMYNIGLTRHELNDWEDYISVLSRKKELD